MWENTYTRVLTAVLLTLSTVIAAGCGRGSSPETIEGEEEIRRGMEQQQDNPAYRMLMQREEERRREIYEDED